jgi:hypothetical protein
MNTPAGPTQHVVDVAVLGFDVVEQRPTAAKQRA